MITKTDQTRALSLSTVAFTLCFAVWTIFSIIGVQIQKDMGLTDTQFSLLIRNADSNGLTSQAVFWYLGGSIWWAPDFHGGYAVVRFFYMVSDLCGYV